MHKLWQGIQNWYDKTPGAGLIVGACIFGLWLLIGLSTWFSIDEAAKAGQFGDTFGMTNSLFSALAFVAVLLGLREQQMANRDTAKANEHAAEINRSAAQLQSMVFEKEQRRELMHFLLQINKDINEYREAVGAWLHERQKVGSSDTDSNMTGDEIIANTLARVEENLIRRNNAAAKLRSDYLESVLLLGEDNSEKLRLAIHGLHTSFDEVESLRDPLATMLEIESEINSIDDEIETLWKNYNKNPAQLNERGSAVLGAAKA